MIHKCVREQHFYLITVYLMNPKRGLFQPNHPALQFPVSLWSLVLTLLVTASFNSLSLVLATSEIVARLLNTFAVSKFTDAPNVLKSGLVGVLTILVQDHARRNKYFLSYNPTIQKVNV